MKEHYCRTIFDDLVDSAPPFWIILFSVGLGVGLGQIGTWYLGMSYHPWATVFAVLEMGLGIAGWWLTREVSHE